MTRTVTFTVETPEMMEDLGRRIAAILRPGDLVLLHGGLGAGKTTLTKGIGKGLGVSGHVSSPTFIIARSHRSRGTLPNLVHVDAYRLSSFDELDALDLDTSLEDAVTVVEWGEGIAEVLSEDRLELRIERPRGGLPAELADVVDDSPREVSLSFHGARWDGVSPELEAAE